VVSLVDYVEIYENASGWHWHRVSGKSGAVTEHPGAFTRYSDAMRDAARECGGNLRINDVFPDRYWVL
jgi:hypothetical protein